jgi:hypothetical protein
MMTDRHRNHGLAPDPAPSGNSPSRLRRLSQLDEYKIANGDPDVRMWNVNDANGERVGVVHDLLVDMETLDVQFLDIALDRRVTLDRQAKAPPHVLVPLALVRLTADADIVTLCDLTWDTLAMLPAYEHDAFTRDDERILLARLEWIAEPAADAGTEEAQRWFTALAFRADRAGDSHAEPYRVDERAAQIHPGGPPPVS